MNIVHVEICTNVFGENHAYQSNLLPRYHAKLGHEVTIIAPPYCGYDNNGKIYKEKPGVKIMVDGVRLVRLKPALPLFINKHTHLFLNFYRAIEQYHPKLLFVHSLSSYNYLELKKYKKKHPDVVIVFDNHADKVNSGHGGLFSKISQIVKMPIIGRAVKKVSNLFYGVTPARCDYLKEMYRIPSEKVKLLPMGASDDDMEWEHKEQLRQQIRNDYNISDDDFLIVTGGKIDKKKNIHVLAQAVANLNNSKIKMLIFGTVIDELKPIIDNIVNINQNIHYIGWLDSSKVYRYFYAADLVMFPGLHSVLWEQAVASHVPCAVSKMNGFEHVNVCDNCILMEGKDEFYYRDLLKKIFEDESLYLQLKNNSENAAVDIFRYSSIAKQVLLDTKLI